MANVGIGARLFKANDAPQELMTVIHNASDTNVLGKGSIVALSGGTASIGNGPIVPKVSLAVSGSPMFGVVEGCEQHTVAAGQINLNRVTAPASTLMYLNVRPINIHDIYVAQEDSVGGSISQANSTKNASLIFAAPNATTGMDGTMIDSSTVATTNTLDVRLLGTVNDPSNVVGSNARFLFQFNNVQSVNQATGV